MLDVIFNASVTEIEGDGHAVTGLRYADKATGSERSIAASGIFIQIGLVPNTEMDSECSKA